MDQVFEQTRVITPSIADSKGRLSFHDVFDVFMDIASEHAQRLGIGLEAMARRDLFWLTVKTQIRFLDRPRIMEPVTVRTWPEAPGKLRGNRSYQIVRGGEVLVAGKTEWAVMHMKSKQLVLLDGVYPSELSFTEGSACPSPFARIPDDFGSCAVTARYTVRSTDIDVGGHMNNAAYVRAMLGCFRSEELRALSVKSIDVVFRSPCFESETLSLQQKQTENGLDLRFAKEDGSTAFLARILS